MQAFAKCAAKYVWRNESRNGRQSRHLRHFCARHPAPCRTHTRHGTATTGGPRNGSGRRPGRQPATPGRSRRGRRACDWRIAARSRRPCRSPPPRAPQAAAPAGTNRTSNHSNFRSTQHVYQTCLLQAMPPSLLLVCRQGHCSAPCIVSLCKGQLRGSRLPCPAVATPPRPRESRPDRRVDCVVYRVDKADGRNSRVLCPARTLSLPPRECPHR